MRQVRENGEEEAAIEQRDGSLLPLFARNRAWARPKTCDDPSFFSRLVRQQRPRYFWIGCSDSRVPATEIVDLDPGEMFVHRNVANLASANDPNFSATLQFAVEVLQAQHIIVVGHYGCGGIQAALAAETDDAIGRWLESVRALNYPHPCSAAPDGTEANALCERNVVARVKALAANPITRAAWEQRAAPTLHGWVYAIGDGLLQTVCDPATNPSSLIQPVNDRSDAL